MIAASQISAVIGNTLPGQGSIYLSQSLQFIDPVFVRDTVKTSMTVTSVKQGKPIATLETICKNQKGEMVFKVEAVVLFPQDLEG